MASGSVRTVRLVLAAVRFERFGSMASGSVLNSPLKSLLEPFKGLSKAFESLIKAFESPLKDL